MNPATSHVLLVTGATGGLGQALVRKMVATHPDIRSAVFGRDRDKLAHAYGAAHVQITADVGEHADAAAVVAKCVAALGTPTQFAHCVGNIMLGPAARFTELQYREVMRANLDH